VHHCSGDIDFCDRPSAVGAGGIFFSCGFFRMDKYIQVLGWVAMGSLALAIARQLSEQKVYDMIPMNFGSVHGPNRLLENFTSPVTSSGQKLGCLTAQTCYEKDFMSQSNKTGNFIQRTNNFRHEKPDDCSPLLTEFVQI